MSIIEVVTLIRDALTLYKSLGHVRLLMFFWSDLIAWGWQSLAIPRS